MGNLQLRILTAIVLIVAVLAITYAGGLWFRLLCAIIAIAVLHEWLTMIGTGGPFYRVAMAAFVVLFAVGFAAGLGSPLLLGLVMLAALAASIAVGERRRWVGAGVVYAGLISTALGQLRGDDGAGLAMVLLLFAAVWATDILAYFVGRAAGGPKLAPRISPGKTWSGAAGGAVAAMVFGVAAGLQLGFAYGSAMLGALCLLLSVASQVGDLAESAFKRRFGAKDSGALLPGHGGMMDRVDGLAGAAIVLYGLAVAVSGWEAPARSFFGT